MRYTYVTWEDYIYTLPYPVQGMIRKMTNIIFTIRDS